MDFKELIKNISIFNGLSDRELDKVISLLKQHSVKRGDIIVTEGELAREMFIIQEGTVEILKGGVALARLWQGDCFGEMTLIDVQPRSASVRAKRNATLFSLSNKDFLSLYEWNLHTYTIIILNIARELSRRLRKADAIIADYASTHENNDDTSQD